MRKGIKKAVICALAPVLILILIIVCIVGVVENLFDWGEDETEAMQSIRDGGSAWDVDKDILADMNLTPDGLEELAAIPEPAGWQPVYELRVPYEVYINQQSKQYKSRSRGLVKATSEMRGYEKYLGYEYITVTGADLSRYALTWQDVYMFASAIYITEKGQDSISAEDIREVRGLIQPEVTYSENIQRVLVSTQTDEDISEQMWDSIKNTMTQTSENKTREVLTITVTPTPTPSPTPTQKANRPDKKPDSDAEKPKEPEVKTEEVEIVAVIERHYTLRPFPAEVTTWNTAYNFEYEDTEYLKDISRPVSIEGSRIVQRKWDDGIAKVTAHYGVGTDALELVADIVTPEDHELFASALNRLGDSGVGTNSPYRISLSYTQASNLTDMAWPFPGEHRLFSLFGPRDAIIQNGVVISPKKIHKGWDIGGEMNAEIVAALAGTVVYASYDASSGNMVVIDHGNGIKTQYMHLNKFLVKVGDKVMQNQPVGLCGSTGASTGAHLHFGLLVNDVNIDPADYLWPAFEKDEDVRYVNTTAEQKLEEWKKKH